MSEDLIIGVAVLDTSGHYHWLHYLKVGRNIDRVSWDDVPLLPEGAPQPEQKLPSHFPENRPWRYRIDGDTIHVSPSINVSNGWWHNAGQWSVKFVPATGASYGDNRRQLISVNRKEDTERLREALE